MEAIKTTGIVKDGFLTVAVPHQYDEQEMEVVVVPISKYQKPPVQTDEEKAHQEKVARLMSIVGTARYPNAPIEDYDVYDQ